MITRMTMRFIQHLSQFTKQCKVIVLCCLVFLGTINSAFAHMLNMTQMELTVSGDKMAQATLTIDLGQSLMSARDYWIATQADRSAQQPLLQPVLDQLNNDLYFLVDGEKRRAILTGFEIGATSLEAIQNPLSPQMATLFYEFDATGGEVVSVGLDPGLEVPWPFLLKVGIAGQRLPVSRLLTDVDRTTSDVFLNSDNQLEFDLAAGLVTNWARFAPELTWIAVGFQHIVPKGLDHILFILGLFFLAGGWRKLLLQITGFTLAHSLTLGLSMYGIVSVPAAVVEPLIALSIVYVAVDNLYASKLARWRIMVVCVFGLLHGLGFAAVLSGIGLPQEQFLLGLALFNIGVELGQISVIAVALLSVGWFKRQAWYESIIAYPATIAIAGTGAFWFLKRIVVL
jgi:hypothetical protein